MTNVIKEVNEAARQTFVDVQSPNFKQKLDALRTLVAKVTACDLKLDKSIRNQWSVQLGQVAPSTYIKIVEHDDYTICIFSLREGTRIPLHNHPDMFGVVKVLKGSIAVKSFTPLPSDGHTYVVPKNIMDAVRPLGHVDLIPSTCNGSHTLSAATNDTSLLFPSDNNLHEISAVDGDASFLDILSPPYDSNERDCLYYAQIGTVSDEKYLKDITWLHEIECPTEFWTTSLPYRGPPVD